MHRRATTATPVARVLLIAAFGLAMASCGPVGTSVNDDGGNPGVDSAVNYLCAARPGQTICDGTNQVVCDANGQEASRQDCVVPLVCVDGSGCVICHPGQTLCQGNMMMRCRPDLMGYEDDRECDPNAGETCDVDEGACANMCDVAAERKSNVGCDYFAVDMGNVDEYNANDSCFVAIVSNVQTEGIAVVTVEDESGTLLDFPGVGTQWHINPQQLAVIPLTGNPGECSLTPARPNATTMLSGLMPGSVFRIKSTLPVVAYQINPYEAAAKHTTDAALLFPIPALGSQYIAATYEGLGSYGYPASVSIVATEDNTIVSVAPAANVTAGGPVPGGSGSFDVTLNAMQHLQILAEGQFDLTTTTITATAPIAVFSGALCANIPANMGYCDHLEEMMPPVNSWGMQYLAAVPPQRANELALWRIIAATDNTQVNIEPFSQYNTVLNRGQVLEVSERESFLVSASSTSPDATSTPIMVVNYLKGSEQTALESGTDIFSLGNQRGDPAMTLSVPIEQYHNSYVFLTDPSYAFNYVVIVRTDPNAPIHMDCLDPIPDNSFVQVSGTYARAVVTLKNESNTGACQNAGDVRTIWSNAPFGIWVYGYFADTSYGYPGGMNLEQINDVVIIVE
ncbi:MAG: IgGFc-binding protein [bacterium]